MKKITTPISPLVNKAIELFAWYGVIAIVGAYAITTLQILPATHYVVLLLNITGSAGILLDAWKDKNYQPVVLNAIWLVIAIIAMIR